MNIIKGHTYAANLDLTSNERLIFLYLVDLSNENNMLSKLKYYSKSCKCI